MALPLKQSNAIAGLADHLYDYLPASGNPQWSGHVTFGTVAAEAGVGKFWPPNGSKTPRIRGLLERTLEYERSNFERLILGIVRAGIAYRAKNNNGSRP